MKNFNFLTIYLSILRLGDSALSLISTLIGSGGLIIFIATSVLSNINQPNIALSVTYHIPDTERGKDNPIIYYEIITKNIGSAQAKNLTLSMFFKTNGIKPTPMIFDAYIFPLRVINASDDKFSYAGYYSPKLSPNAEIILHVGTKNGHNGDSYYISATYDQGTARAWFINGNDQFTNKFPDVSKGNSQPPVNSQILLVAAIVSIISFSIAFFHWIAKESTGEEKAKVVRKIFVILPATVAGSTVILILTDELVRNTVVPAIFIPPLDITHYPLSSTIYNYFSRGHIDQLLSIQYAVVLVLFIAALRSIGAYMITRLVIRILHPKKPQIASANIFLKISLKNSMKTILSKLILIILSNILKSSKREGSGNYLDTPVL